MKTVVVYYTRFGHTTTVAETLAKELGAELRRIEETKQRGYPGMGFGAMLGSRFKLKPMDLDFSGCDRVVLCTPIWAGRPACPTRTFLRDAKLDGRRLAVLISNMSRELDKALEIIRKDLAGRNVEIVARDGVFTQDATPEQLAQAARTFAARLKT